MLGHSDASYAPEDDGRIIASPTLIFGMENVASCCREPRAVLIFTFASISLFTSIQQWISHTNLLLLPTSLAGKASIGFRAKYS